MTRLLLALLLFASIGCTAEPPRLPPAAPTAPAGAEVAVARRNGGRWTAEFRFRRQAPAWAFTRSALTREGERPWRPQSWTVETPGVRLERIGHYDVLVAADGGMVPERVRIRFTPFPGDLIADYDPALVFSGGAVALYTEQFDAFPLTSRGQAERLPLDLSDARDVDFTRTRVTFRDQAGTVLHAGRRQASVTVDSDEGGYVLFGRATAVTSEAMVAIIDPALPAWIRSALARSTPEILARYAEALGPAPGSRPTLMVSWAGATPGRTSMGGSVLPGLIVMTYEGEGVLAEDADLRGRGLWFIAHESAHFWLGEAVRYQFSRDAWITEGGADLLAIRTVAAVDPGYDWRSELNGSIRDCVSLSTGRGVASAEQRNEHRAYYACGAVFGLVAEAASRRPFSAFVRELIDANRSDRVLTREEWLAGLDRASSDPSLSADIARLLDQGAADPKTVIASLFARAGVAHTIGADGLPRLQ